MELLDNTPVQSKNINLKKEISKYLRNWYWILLSMLLFYTAARIYLRYAEPYYLSKTSLKLYESKNSSSALSDLKNLGMGVSGDEELKSETAVIISKPILVQVVENLGLNISYFNQGTIKETEMYNDAPVSVRLISVQNPKAFNGAVFIIEPSGKGGFKVTEGEHSGKVFSLNKPVEFSFGTLVVQNKAGFGFARPIKLIIQSTRNTVKNLENAISVSIPEEKGLIMELSLTGTVPEKSEDILNELTAQYNKDGIKDKNLEAQNTQDFINERLNVITEDLSGIENQKEGFKRQNNITDIETQANLALNNSNENTKQLIQYSTQLDLVNSIYKATSGDKLLPSNMGLSPLTENYISQYNELLLTRNKTLKQATGLNPSVIDLNKQVSEMKDVIRRNLQESKETLQLQIAHVQGQLNADRSKINKFPTQEKIFRSIDRQQGLKEQLYLYLLQKREENAITLQVATPKAKIVNPAYTLGKVKPNNKAITTGALAAGFLLPLLFLFVKYSLDTKVRSKEQVVSHIPDASVIAEIPVHEQENQIVKADDFSFFAESFRILTSNLKFMLRAKIEDGKGVILVTSTVKGEGKTTIAMNTALALAGKSKVLILGADIRNPQLHRFIDGKNVGLTDYLVSDSSSPETFVKNSGISKNLDVMFSGAIAPNPNDLLDMQKFDNMIAHLRSSYDYVVIDSAPVMLVSDSLHLIEVSDLVLYVVKSDFTEKEMLDFAAEFRANNKIGNIAYVLNNVKPENSRYGRKYGYGYYNDSPKKSFLKKLFGN
ncbi:MAG: polysaccharide biosynthesis tyrosine autokinase [Bergeyella sp.]